MRCLSRAPRDPGDMHGNHDATHVQTGQEGSGERAFCRCMGHRLMVSTRLNMYKDYKDGWISCI